MELSKSKRKTNSVEMAKLDDDLVELRTDRQVRFVQEYCKDFVATKAAIRAGYSEHTAQEIGSELLSKPIIKAAVARRLAAIADEAKVDSTLVISELYQLATADPRELMRVETDCCRCCYGIEHRYMWTPAEFARATADALAAGKLAPELGGGIGYDPRRPPVESCVECWGRGIDRVVITPSKKLSRAAARLLASMKQNKDGCIELKTLDQQAALMALGKITGAIRDRTELTGPGGGALQLQPVQPALLSTEALEAILRKNGKVLPHRLIEGSTATND